MIARGIDLLAGVRTTTTRRGRYAESRMSVPRRGGRVVARALVDLRPGFCGFSGYFSQQIRVRSCLLLATWVVFRNEGACPADVAEVQAAS